MRFPVSRRHTGPPLSFWLVPVLILLFRIKGSGPAGTRPVCGIRAYWLHNIDALPLLLPEDSAGLHNRLISSGAFVGGLLLRFVWVATECVAPPHRVLPG